MQRGLAPILIVLILAGAIVLVSGVYYLDSKVSISFVPTIVNRINNPNLTEVSWKTYIGNNFSFKYPSDWEVEEFAGGLEVHDPGDWRYAGPGSRMQSNTKIYNHRLNIDHIESGNKSAKMNMEEEMAWREKMKQETITKDKELGFPTNYSDPISGRESIKRGEIELETYFYQTDSVKSFQFSNGKVFLRGYSQFKTLDDGSIESKILTSFR